jgi:hypothetical protein
MLRVEPDVIATVRATKNPGALPGHQNIDRLTAAFDDRWIFRIKGDPQTKRSLAAGDAAIAEV